MNIIFLDIDGVVATPVSVEAYPMNGKLWSMCPTLMKAVAQLAIKCEGRIVVTSTWRYHHSFVTWHDLMCAHQVGNTMYNERNPDGNESPVWCTPRSKNGFRGDEVDAWIKECEEKRHPVDNYVILDDDSDFTDHQKEHHFVHTNGLIGLTFDDYLKAAKILGIRD